MTESMFTGKLIRALKQHPALREAWIQKHNDRSSAGIPDLSVSIGCGTLWIEVKVAPYRPTRLQDWTLRKLGVGAMLVAALNDGRSVAVVCYDNSSAKFLDFDNAIEEIVNWFKE